jgi:two-component system sensor histidine kinase TctE
VDDIVGSGLGLTIADEVARAHGGKLEISANTGGTGACVTVILPRS